MLRARDKLLRETSARAAIAGDGARLTVWRTWDNPHVRRLLYYLGKYDYDLPSPFVVPHESIEFDSLDGVQLSGAELEGSGDLSFLVVHGLFAHHRAPGLFQFAESLTRFGPVTAFDLRGHGLSDGICTLGNLEALDVAAAIVRARKRWDRPLVVIGFSMGAAAAVRGAALHESADAVVAVSAPADWHGPRRRAAKRTRLVWKVPGGTEVMRLLTGVRIDRRWEEPESPASVAGKIAPSPLLVVHGVDDDFFPPEEAETLYAGAREPKNLWLIPGGGHAEGLFMRPGDAVDRKRVGAFAEEIVGRVRSMLSAEQRWPA